MCSAAEASFPLLSQGDNDPNSSIATAPTILKRLTSDRKTLLERELLIDNLLVRMHLIIEMILVDRPCATRV